MRKAAIALGVLLLLLAVAILLLRSEDDSPSVAPTPPPRDPPAHVVGNWSPASNPSSVKLEVSVTENGRPVDKAIVTLWLVGDAHQDAVTDAQGLVTFSVLPGSHRISALAPERSAQRVITISSLWSEHRAELVFAPPPTLAVTVLDNEYRGLEGALVELHLASEEPRSVVVSVRTGLGGRALLGGFAPNLYLLSVSAPGYVSSLDTYIEQATRAQQVLLDPQVPFSGRVLTADGKGAAGATISADAVTAISGRDGTFTFPFTPATVCARLDDLVASGSPGEEEEQLRLVLGPQVSFEGQVLAVKTEQPLEGVRVRAGFGSLASVTLTDREGRFTIPGLCGGEAILATFERAGSITESATLAKGEKTVVHLQSGGALRGTVVDDKGQGVAGAKVSAFAYEGEQATLTDSTGHFAFEQVRRLLTVSASEGYRVATESVEVEPGQLVELTLNLGAVRMLVPVEVFEEGKPSYRTFQVKARGLYGLVFEESMLFKTGGQFPHRNEPTSIRLPEGSFNVIAESDEAFGETEFRVQPGDVQPTLRILVKSKPPPPPKETKSVSVRVLSSRGTAIVGQHVTCTGDEGVPPTDDTGRTVCKLDASCLGDVQARMGGSVVSAHVTDPSAEVVLQFPPGVTIRGHIVGLLVPELELKMISKQGMGTIPIAAADFVLIDQPPTRSILCLQVGLDRLGCKVVIPETGRDTEVTLQMGAPGELRFTSLDSRGQKVLDPIIFLDRNTNWRGSDAGVVTSLVAPGDHVLVVNIEGSEERYETIFKVEPGRTTDLGQVQLK